jgi:hypothetical protein
MYNTDTLSALELAQTGPISSTTTAIKTLPTIQESASTVRESPAPTAGASRRTTQYRFEDVSMSRKLRRIQRRLLLDYLEENQKMRNRADSITSTTSLSSYSDDDSSIWGSSRSSDSSVTPF